mmetsp:Transcript_21583/g.67371  ORF Transcript_21583/g.67371 Transcript_21583/m.67371 type:complete len:284 (-) Transcript_21583:1086-1937(-)
MRLLDCLPGRAPAPGEVLRLRPVQALEQDAHGLGAGLLCGLGDKVCPHSLVELCLRSGRASSAVSYLHAACEPQAGTFFDHGLQLLSALPQRQPSERAAVQRQHVKDDHSWCGHPWLQVAWLLFSSRVARVGLCLRLTLDALIRLPLDFALLVGRAALLCFLALHRRLHQHHLEDAVLHALEAAQEHGAHVLGPLGQLLAVGREDPRGARSPGHVDLRPVAVKQPLSPQRSLAKALQGLCEVGGCLSPHGEHVGAVAGATTGGQSLGSATRQQGSRKPPALGT